MRGAGRVSLDHAAMAAVYFFEDLSVPLAEYGIRVRQPSVQEVKQILRVRVRACVVRARVRACACAQAERKAARALFCWRQGGRGACA